MKNWDLFPIRTCQSMRECRLCKETISLGQRYYDGGLKWRAHEECVKTCEIGVTKAWVHSPILGVLSEKVSVLLTNQELEDIFVALESYNWNQERKQRCRAIILRIRPYLQRQVDEIRFGETRSEL